MRHSLIKLLESLFFLTCDALAGQLLIGESSAVKRLTRLEPTQSTGFLTTSPNFIPLVVLIHTFRANS